jgi:hypothetical protein
MVVDDVAAHCAKGAAAFWSLSDTTLHKSRLSAATKQPVASVLEHVAGGERSQVALLTMRVF